MEKCMNCGKNIPDWYEIKLCDLCLENKFYAFYEEGWGKTMDDSYYLNSHSNENENEDLMYDKKVVKAVLNLEKEKQGLYELSLEDVQKLLKNSSEIDIMHVILLTMLRERSSSLITGLCFFGETEKLSLDIEKLLKNRRVKWLDSFTN